MSIADDVNRLKSPGRQGNDSAPDGWRARLELDSDDGGYLVSEPYDPQTPADHTEEIAKHGLDPDAWTITKVRRSRWQVYDGRWLEAFKIDLVPAGQSAADRADVEQLVDRIGRWRPRTTTTKHTREGTFVVPSGDLQLGKPDGGGTAATVDRFLHETELTLRRLRRTLGKGKKAATVVLPWLGDCIEGIVSQSGANNMRLDLTPTEQVRVYRRLMWAQVEQFAHVADRLIIPVVPGNHDEPMRIAGKQPTPADDSWAIEGAVAVQDGIERNPELAGRVEFRFPGHDSYTITLNVGGTMIGMCHGHQFGRGRDGWRSWWNDQGGGRTPIGQADVLLAAHSHHLRVQDHGDGRLFLQIPALDGGSRWFTERFGDDTPSRMLSFWTRDGAVWGLDPVTARPC